MRDENISQTEFAAQQRSGYALHRLHQSAAALSHHDLRSALPNVAVIQVLCQTAAPKLSKSFWLANMLAAVDLYKDGAEQLSASIAPAMCRAMLLSVIVSYKTQEQILVWCFSNCREQGSPYHQDPVGLSGCSKCHCCSCSCCMHLLSNPLLLSHGYNAVCRFNCVQHLPACCNMLAEGLAYQALCYGCSCKSCKSKKRSTTP